MSTWVYPRSNNLLTLSQAAIVTTARHLCTKLNSVYNLYTFLYRFLGHLRVYTWVFLYPSVARYPSSYLRVQETAPSLVSQSQSPSLVSQSQSPPSSGLLLGLPPFPAWSSPQSGISKPEPQVWYLKARTSPLSGLLLSLPLLLCGVVWSNVLLRTHGRHLQGPVQ